MTTPPARTPDGPGTEVRPSGLDRRRDTMQHGAAAAVSAAKAVATLERQLENNAGQVRKDQAALHAAHDTVAELKKSITVAGKKSTTMKTALKKARRGAAKAAQRAQHAEAKYDKAVLAEIIAKEKASDLSAHPGAARTTRTSAPTPITGASAKTSKPPSATTTRPRAARPARA